MYRGRRILVIDDDTGLLQVLRASLEADGYSVLVASNGEEGLRIAYKENPDLLVLDVMMPGLSGWDVCRHIRRMSSVPIIMLTALSTVDEKKRGLRLGADDYITKPFAHGELVARMEALFRRVEMEFSLSNTSVYDDGVLKIDLQKQQVHRKGRPVHLSPKEYALLSRLVETPGQIVPHQELLTHVWGARYSHETGYLSVYIRYLRQKLEDEPSNPRYILTRWRLGYLFNPAGRLSTSRPGHEGSP